MKKEKDDFLDDFRRILNEACPRDDLNGFSLGLGFDEEGKFARVPQIHYERDPVEVRAQLINLVKQSPELYDKSNTLYKNNAHKGVLWSGIAKEIGNGATGKKVREQWSYMRRKFEEEFFSRKAGNPPTATDPSKRHLFTFDQLSFLEPYISTDRSDSPNGEAADADGTENEDSQQLEDPFSNNHSASSSGSQNLNDFLWQLANASTKLSSGLLPSLTGGLQLGGDLLGTEDSNRLSGPPPLGTLGNNEDSLTLGRSRGRKRRLCDETNADVPLASSSSSSSSSTGNAVPLKIAEEGTLKETVARLSRCLEDIVSKQLEDECTLFGRQIAHDLRRLSDRDRLLARQRITDSLTQFLVADAEAPKVANVGDNV